MGNELLQTYGKNENDVTGAAIDGVGLFAHEFGHALGLPDYYNTQNSSAFNTMGFGTSWTTANITRTATAP